MLCASAGCPHKPTWEVMYPALGRWMPVCRYHVRLFDTKRRLPREID